MNITKIEIPKIKFPKKISPIMLVLGIILGLYCLVLLFPLLWGLFTSFKSSNEYLINPLGLPESINFDNYYTTYMNFFVEKKIEGGIGYANIFELYWNGILFALGGALVQTFVTCIVAYVTARFPCKFSTFIYSFVIFTMSLQIVGSLPAQIQLSQALGIYDNIIGTWFLRSHFLNMYYLVFYAAFKSLSKEYNEAAAIDGAGNVRQFCQIQLPLVVNVFITVTLLLTIAFWNDYQTPMMFLPNHPTIALGVYKLSRVTNASSPFSSPPMRVTSCMFLLIPMLIIFLIFSKRLLNNVTLGGVKE